MTLSLALSPPEFLRSIASSRDTLGRRPMRILDVVSHVGKLTDDAPYAIVGGLAQMLWARKTHTDDLDVALASGELARAVERVERHQGDPEWAVPCPPDRAHEENDVFEVAHLLYDGAVVDLLSWKHEPFTAEVLTTAVAVPELGGLRFARPELLLVTYLLRPGALGALAALDLAVARLDKGDLDVPYTERWAGALGKSEALVATLRRARDLLQ